jgi:ABC-type branched-subunit amino acid transport system ATPase component
VADEVVADLPHGTQKLVGVARALATDPSVLLLDEPAAGLDAEEGRAFGVRLRGLAADGLSIVLVDHDVELVMSTCDRVVVLDFGSVIASGTPERIRADRRVQEAYLGAPSPDPGRPS